MIDKALEVLAKGIQEYLVRLPDLNINSQETAKVTHIVKADGSLEIPSDSIGLCLVNVEEERVIKSQYAVMPSDDGTRISHINPDIKLNLFVLIAAHFTTYQTGLKFLSGAIQFFQSKNVFTRQNTPNMDRYLEKLVVELYSLNFEQQNHLWGALGAKYLPSVLYKVRIVVVDEQTAIDDQRPIKAVNTIYKGM